jgi:ABC-type transport system, involved in lipoprotein release, permease component
MYIFLNALKNVVRNKGRNFLIAVIIFAVIATTVVTLMINNTTSGVIDDYKTRFGAQVNISVDIDKFIQSNPPQGGASAIALPQVSVQQSISFAESEYIKEYIIRVSKDVTNDDFTAIDENSTGNMMVPIGDENTMGKFMLTNLFNDFDNGLRYVIEGGRMVENDRECLISEEFAALNELSVNDEIILYDTMTNPDNDTKRTVEYKLTVVGIYYDFTEEYSGARMSLSNRRNEILTTTDTLLSSMNEDEIGLSVSATYFLKNPSMIKDFETEIRSKGLSDYMAVKADEDGYNKIIAPVEGLKSISITFMIIVLLLGSIIITLLYSIAIRERKYEIGVLRAMGMKKIKVALGLWIEIAAITCICLCVGLLVGVLIAQPVGNLLLAEQVKAAQTTQNISGGPINLSNPSDSALPTLEHLDISLGLQTIIGIIGISLLITFFASITTISKIIKYEPIKILMERN